MSMTLMAQAMKCKVGNPARKLVLIKLADNANDNGHCYPSYQYVADQCEISKRSVIEHIKQLEADGLIKKSHRKTDKGNSSNLYILTLTPSEKSAPEVVKNLHGGSEESAPPPSEKSAPRTSHSSQPVNETKESAVRVAHYLHERLVSEIPEIKANPKAWVTDVERAIRIDDRTEQDLISIIDWMHTGNKFWVANIQSGKKLREKYNTMIAQKRQREEASNDPHQRFNPKPDKQSSYLDELAGLG